MEPDIVAFEWDANKESLNVKRHGLTFKAAIRVFGDLHRLDKLDDREDYGEERWLALGSVAGRIIVVAYTMRGIGERRASSRRARRKGGRSMSTFRITTADFREPFSFNENESAFLDRVTDEELHDAASADPDNPPWTPEMFEVARRGRQRRLALEEAKVGLRPVTPSGQGIWAVTDAGGRTVYLQAANVEPVQGGHAAPLYEIIAAGGSDHS